MAFNINNETKQISITRGDRGTIRLTRNDGSFKQNDSFKFSIIEKSNYNNVVFQKEFKVLHDSTYFDITLTKQDTNIGDIINTKKEYWYEIEYNGDQTIIGFDQMGAKKFIIYPEAPTKKGGDI